MSDRKQIAFNNSIQDQFMKTEGNNATDKMTNLLSVYNKRKAEKRDVDKKINALTDSVNEIKKMLEGVIR